MISLKGGGIMSIAGDLIRGHTDAIILARLLQSDSYGYEINKTISTLSAGQFELKEATLYTAFKRLEEQGYIASYWGDSGAGARRRYYTITPEGRYACRRLLAEWRRNNARTTDSICGTAICRHAGRGGYVAGNSAEHPGPLR